MFRLTIERLKREFQSKDISAKSQIIKNVLVGENDAVNF